MSNIKLVDKYKDSVWERDLYTANVEYIIGENIYEYDMKSAGLNLCIYYELLDEKTIKYLKTLSKFDCSYEIGRIQKYNVEFSKKLTKSFAKMRKIFFIANDISDSNILSIKKDAIFIINKRCEVTKFKNVEFVLKHKYTSYHSFDKYEFYFRSKGNAIDVKGINDEKLIYHNEYMISFLKDIFRMLELENNAKLVNKVKKFAHNYKAKILPVEYYRELNAGSMFSMFTDNDNLTLKTDGYIDNFDIDISYNYMHYVLTLIQRYFFLQKI